MKLLLLEDDYLYQVSIKDFLIENGYEVDAFADGDEALDAIYNGSYALLLLDIRVPGMDGYEILKEVRSSGLETPVIMLTSLTDIEDLSLGYELGCSDYIRKPFALKELKYRIEHITKVSIYKNDKADIVIDGLFRFDTRSETLLREGVPVELSAMEIRLVATMVQHMGYYLSLEQLRDAVWEGRDVSYADIRMCINRVRQKCGKAFIQTKKMVGYKIG